MWRILVAVGLVGCTSGDGKTDDTAGGGDDTGGDTNDTVDTTVAPEVSSVDRVECTTQQSAGEVWQMDLTVSDPQGLDTVPGGTVAIQNESGGELASYDIICNEGACIGSFRADYDGVSCAMEGTIAFVFVVTDEDGNSSAAKTYTTW